MPAAFTTDLDECLHQGAVLITNTACALEAFQVDSHLLPTASLTGLDTIPHTPAVEQGEPLSLDDHADIWTDAATLAYLKAPGADTTQFLTLVERRRVQRRAHAYKWDGEFIHRRFPDGQLRQVPAPEARHHIVELAHQTSGHFGRRRTTALISVTYWWSGMYQDVRDVVRECAACAQSKVSFRALQPVLHPLPITSMFYRWHVDLAGPFPATSRGNTYIMVAIDSFTKMAEVFCLTDKSAPQTAYWFLHGILARYGACGEVVTDGGGEWQAEFDVLLTKTLIDHRVTSPVHPQANGLCERLVRTMRVGINRMMQDGTGEWDLYLPWVVMGYRLSPQESTGFSPFELVYGVPPELPAFAKRKCCAPLSLDDPVRAAESLLERAKLLERALPMIRSKLEIAQQRDTYRYATLRSGAYLPQLVDFTPGQFVYVKDIHDSTLHPKAKREILRVLEVRPSGVVLLQGKCGATITWNAVHVAPCHLPIVGADELADVSEHRPRADVPCEICKSPKHAAVLLLCDSCDRGWHLYCLTPPLKTVPEGDWICPQCERAGVSVVHLRTGTAQHDHRFNRRRTADGTALPVRAIQRSPSVPELVSSALMPARRSPRRAPPPAVDAAAPPVRLTQPRQQRFRSLKRSVIAAASDFDWETPEGAWVAAHQLMPGPWDDAAVQRLAHYALHTAQGVTNATTVDAELATLFTIVNTCHSPSIVDICATDTQVVTLLDELGHIAVSNAFASTVLSMDHHGNAAQPSTYGHMRSEFGCHVIIARPFLPCADAILPLAAMYAQHCACCLVPAAYLNERLSHPPRHRWLEQLREEERLVIVAPAALAGDGIASGNVWLVILRDASLRGLLLHSHGVAGL
jgi:hypothetical protein